jgi:ABC-type bacteriocin/lantibiotic exporter with double-glycine peptidase domain
MNWHRSRGLPEPLEPLMLLELPDVRQENGHDCGEAAACCVARFFGTALLTRSLASPEDGTHPSALETVFRRAGFAVQAGTMTLADLKHHVAQGRPVLCCVAQHGGHWVVVRGVGRGKVYYQCPVDGPLSMRAAEFASQWADVTRAGHEFARWGIAVGR